MAKFERGCQAGGLNDKRDTWLLLLASPSCNGLKATTAARTAAAAVRGASLMVARAARVVFMPVTRKPMQFFLSV